MLAARRKKKEEGGMSGRQIAKRKKEKGADSQLFATAVRNSVR